MNYVETYTKLTKLNTWKVSAVYIIRNKLNNKYYIGGAVNVYDRIRLHIGGLLKNKHHNSPLQNAVNKYGIQNFEFDILEEYPKEVVFGMETYWISMLDATNKSLGYNIDRYSKTRLGAVLSDQTKEKIRQKTKLQVFTKISRIKSRRSARETLGKSVVQLTLKGKYLRTFKCINDVEKIGIKSTNVVRHLKGKQKTVNGSIFVYKSKYRKNKKYNISVGKSRKEIKMFNLQGKHLKTFKNSTEAAVYVNGNHNNVNAVCLYYFNKTLLPKNRRNLSYKSYIWKFK